MEIYMHLEHPFPPVFDPNSRILILGSFPSVKSREQGFFYGHPQNRFWRVTAAVMACSVPETTEEKRAFLLSNGIALWDVIASCEIENSADSSIRNAVANDLSRSGYPCRFYQRKNGRPFISEIHRRKCRVLAVDKSGECRVDA